MSVKNYRDLLVWQRAIELSNTVYEYTRSFPKEEIYGLASQMRRSAVSVASNVAEGAVRNGTKEFIQFLYIAKASAAELDTQIEIAKCQKFIAEKDTEKLQNEIKELDNMFYGLISKLKDKQ